MSGALPELPAEEPVAFRNESDYYGASFVAARHAGVRFEGAPLVPFWQHGWAPDFWQVHPYLVLGSLRSHDKSTPFLVTRKSEEAYLKRLGWKNVRASGKPLVYLPPAHAERVPGSLLVMPVHSAFYTENPRSFESYARRIDAVRDKFSSVTVCVSPPCLERGYWSDDFRRLGFHIVAGASIFDRLAYFRMQALFSAHEYVTTNSFGSLIPYAAYCGAKVSVWGDYCAYTARDFANSPFNAQYPWLDAEFVRLYSEKEVRARLPRFFVDPWNAAPAHSWAAAELGEENRLAPAEMAGLFGWTARDRASVFLKQALLFVAPTGSGRLERANRAFHRLRMAHARSRGRRKKEIF